MESISGVREGAFEDFSRFFRGREVDIYPGGQEAAFKEMGSMLISALEDSEYGKGILNQAKKINCQIIFNPNEVNEQGRLRREQASGEFYNNGGAAPDELKIYVDDPEFALVTTHHEGTHLLQKVKVEKAFPGVKLWNLDFNKNMAANMVLEADAFTRQVENIFFEKPETFAKLKNGLGGDLFVKLANTYEAEYRSHGKTKEARDAAYTATFDTLIKDKQTDKFYSNHYGKFYADTQKWQYLHHDLNIAKLVQVVSNKRYKTPDKVTKLIADEIAIPSAVWEKMNRESSFCKVTNPHWKVDQSHTDFKIDFSDNPKENYFTLAKRYVNEVANTNPTMAIGGNGLNKQVEDARRHMMKTIKHYQRNKLDIGKNGEYIKEFKSWLALEKQLAKTKYPNAYTDTSLLMAEKYAENLVKTAAKENDMTKQSLFSKIKTGLGRTK